MNWRKIKTYELWKYDDVTQITMNFIFCVLIKYCLTPLFYVFLMCLQMPHESTVAHEHEQRLSKEDNAASATSAAATLKSVSETVLNASKNSAVTTTVDEASSESFMRFSRLPLAPV